MAEPFIAEERLRYWASHPAGSVEPMRTDMLAAADEIERLKRENARMRRYLAGGAPETTGDDGEAIVRGLVRHWNEFGPEHGLDEMMHYADRWLKRREVKASAPRVCCHKCTPQQGFNAVMILCPDCGNKRCPKASDHDLPCTGSNESGQPGSVY